MNFDTDPKSNSLVDLPDVLANLTFPQLAANVPDNCTGHCTPATQLFGYITWGRDMQTLNDVEDVPITLITTLVRNCTTPGLLDEVSNGQIVDWFLNLSMNTGNTELLVLPVTVQCFSEFCTALSWEGNPDISGIGVNIAFIIQAILTALFLFIYAWFSIAEIHHGRKYPGQSNQRITLLWRKAVDDCLEVFWSTCYVFAFTLVIGTLCFNVVYDSPGHVYSGYFGFLGAVLSVSVLVCLRPWFPGRYRYPGLTSFGILVLLGLMIGVSVTFITEVNSEDKTIFEKLCLEQEQDFTYPDWWKPTKSITYVQNFVRYTPYGIPALTVFWAVALVSKHIIPNWKLYKIITGILGGLLVFGSFGLVCGALWLFIFLRRRVETLAGKTYADNKWGFGQFVAIIAWFPLVAQIFMIFFRTTLKDTKFQKYFNPVPENEMYKHHLLAQSSTVEQQYIYTPDVERSPLTSVTQQDITDARQR